MIHEQTDGTLILGFGSIIHKIKQAMCKQRAKSLKTPPSCL